MCIKTGTIRKNTNVLFAINMNFLKSSEACDLKLKKSKCFDLRVTSSRASFSNSLFHFGLPTGFSLEKTI